MKNPLPFTEEYQKLLLGYDFEYFLKKDIEANQYSKESVAEIYQSYQESTSQLKTQLKENKKQRLKVLDGDIRLLFTGGQLPALFRLDGFTKQHTIIDFKAIGTDWAYFDIWKKEQLKKDRWNKLWIFFTRTGAVLAFLLTGIKILEWAGSLF